jgi:hypothetical protein
LTQKAREALARFGEEFVFNSTDHIIQQFFSRDSCIIKREEGQKSYTVLNSGQILGTVTWTSYQQERGDYSPYDILINFSGSENEVYLEVKTTLRDPPDATVSMTRNQWEFAKQHHNDYWLVIVWCKEQPGEELSGKLQVQDTYWLRDPRNSNKIKLEKIKLNISKKGL